MFVLSTIVWFSSLLSIQAAINIGIAVGINNNAHHPDKLISFNLLTETAICGSKVNTPNIALVWGDKKPNTIVKIIFTRTKVQYSLLVALPSNVKNFPQVWKYNSIF